MPMQKSSRGMCISIYLLCLEDQFSGLKWPKREMQEAKDTWHM